jgi:hypothetical protein
VIRLHAQLHTHTHAHTHTRAVPHLLLCALDL